MYRKYLLAALAVGSVSLAGCGFAQGTAEKGRQEKPAQVVAGTGTANSRVVLTQATAQRLGIKTDVVREVAFALAGEATGTKHSAIPVAAVLYDANGATWTYASNAPLTYVREAVAIGRIDGELAILKSGPAMGTAVVTLGGPELLGIEHEPESE